MYKLVVARQIDVAPHKAESLIRLNTFQGQRPMSPRVINTYANLMLTDRFRVAEIAVAVMPDGTQYLMNGQHTCQSGIMAKKTFKASYQEYSCETDQDLWMLFGSFDVHRARSESNIMKAARGLFENEELNAVPLRVLQVSASALLYLGSGMTPNFATRALTKVDKASLVDKHKEDVLITHEYCSHFGKSMQVGVVIALMATFRKNPGKARVFWDRVILGDKLERGTPQYALNHFLYALAGKVPNGGMSGHITRYKTCVAWWNSFIDGTNRSVVKIKAMKTLPEVYG